MAPWVKIKPAKASEAGVQYNAADGGIISSLGEKELEVVNDTCVTGKITVQLCDKVNKFLVAVSKMGRAGNKIVFFDDDGQHRIVKKVTGEET